MPEDLNLSQIGSSQLLPPLRGLHSPGVRKHCQFIFACYFRKSSITHRLTHTRTHDFNVPSTQPHHRVSRPATASESYQSRDGLSQLFYTSPKPHSSLYHKFVLFTVTTCRAQEVCESRGGRPGLPSLISLQFL